MMDSELAVRGWDWVLFLAGQKRESEIGEFSSPIHFNTVRGEYCRQSSFWGLPRQ